jgi:hypothetical protein
MANEIEETERFFSIELKSKTDLKSITLTNGAQDNVLVEGTIGELVQATFAEGVILEIAGKKGTLRINLKEKELRKETKGEDTSVNEKESREVKLCQ